MKYKESLRQQTRIFQCCNIAALKYAKSQSTAQNIMIACVVVNQFADAGKKQKTALGYDMAHKDQDYPHGFKAQNFHFFAFVSVWV